MTKCPFCCDRLRFLLSAPEAGEVSVVLAAYRDGRMVRCDIRSASLSYGRNMVELTLNMAMDESCVYQAYLLSGEGMISLTDKATFSVSGTKGTAILPLR